MFVQTSLVGKSELETDCSSSLGRLLQLPGLLLLAILHLEDLHLDGEHRVRPRGPRRPHHQGHGDRRALVRARHRRRLLVAAHLIHSGEEEGIVSTNAPPDC